MLKWLRNLGLVALVLLALPVVAYIGCVIYAMGTGLDFGTALVAPIYVVFMFLLQLLGAGYHVQ